MMMQKKHENGEFDVFTHDELGYIFYEVKFKNKPISKNAMFEEIEKVKKCVINSDRFGFISKSGFVEKIDDVIQINIDDLYNFDE